MKSKDKKQLHAKTIDELKQQLRDLRKDLFELRLDKEQNKLKNTKSLMIKSKEIAQVLSVISEMGKTYE